MRKKFKRPEPVAEPQPGVAAGGESINPSGLPETPESAAAGEQPRAAPAPGIPISKEEYERLKEAARTAPTPAVNNAQEDRPPRKNAKGRPEPSSDGSSQDEIES
jgi:hypothetical protein